MLKLALPLILLGAAAAPPAPVKTAAELHAKDVAGVVAFQASGDMVIQSPVFNRKSTWRSWIVLQDGEPVKTRVLALTVDGKPAPEKDRLKFEHDSSSPKSRERNRFDSPFDKRHLGAYTYAVDDCKCGPGEKAFTFKAVRKDAHHGDGRFVLGKDGRIKQMTYTPGELPPRVDRAEVSMEGGGTDPWGMTDFHIRYSGNVGPLSGSFNLSQRQSGHRRFPSVEAALAAAPR